MRSFPREMGEYLILSSICVLLLFTGLKKQKQKQKKNIMIVDKQNLHGELFVAELFQGTASTCISYLIIKHSFLFYKTSFYI